MREKDRTARTDQLLLRLAHLLETNRLNSARARKDWAFALRERAAQINEMYKVKQAFSRRAQLAHELELLRRDANVLAEMTGYVQSRAETALKELGER